MANVYADILETLTAGLYNEVNFAVREYLQNSYDAIKEAIKGEFKEPEDGYHVTVRIQKDNKTITISDNGIGMDKDILDRYTSIGGGTKNSPDLAGHKGIGKLSGLRFFDKFVVRTKKVNNKTYELTWKSGEMMKKLENEKELMQQTLYEDFIKDYVEFRDIEEKDEDKDEHFTQVQLIDVNEDYVKQVSEESIIKFIKSDCPVEFYKDGFMYTDRITKWLDGEVSYVKTFVNDDKKITQHYNDKYNLVEPFLREIKYSDHVRAKVWFSWIKDKAEIISEEEIRGIKFRCKGICVGDNNLFVKHCMPGGSETFANWFTGEVIILDDTIIPSAARDRFYEDTKSRKLYKELKKQVGSELRRIADIRSRIHAAEQDLAHFKKAKSEGKETANILNKINHKIKELKKDRDKPELPMVGNKYGFTTPKHQFNFGIIEKLEEAIKTAEKNRLEEIPEKKKQISKLIDEGDTEALLETMLGEQKEEVKAHTPKTKKAAQELIDTMKIAIIDSANKKEGKPLDSDKQELLSKVVHIIIKYLEINEIHYNEASIKQFVSNELSNG